MGKARVLNDRGDEVEVFRMTLGGETINLLPLRNWYQLDAYKWTTRGKLPGSPAGLEITFDHVKVSGEAVLISDPDGPDKLRRLLNDWLALELETLERARQKARAKPAFLEPEAVASPETVLPHFRVEVDKEGQVHLHCCQGKEILATIGLNLPGFIHLFNEGLMHRPHSLKVGALHDWVELDGELFSFERGNNDADRLQEVLNTRYLSAAGLGEGKDVLVFSNAASSTGFDIVFTAKVGGVTERRRRPLNEEALELLQSAEKCGLVPKDLVIKLSRPNLIFKRKTPDGGERYLRSRAENIVNVVGDAGALTVVDLSTPVNYLRLSAVELTAVFNHPTINQQSRAAVKPVGRADAPARVQPTGPLPVEQASSPFVAVPRAETEPPPVEMPRSKPELSPPPPPLKPVSLKPSDSVSGAQSAHVIRPLPNLWLKAVLDGASIGQEWFNCLVYTRLAEYFGNSEESFFGPFPCWVCSLTEVEDISDPAFRGVFLTEKGWLGYLNQGQIARFRNEVAFLGTLESTIEGIGVNLVAVGVDSQQRIVFVVNEGYHTKFGVPAQTVVQELTKLRQYGGWVLSVNEALQSPDAIDVIWTVPVEQEDPSEPQAAEDLRPEP